jgi:hypothetical protein
MAFQSIQEAFSSFLDKVVAHKAEWETKEDLLQLFYGTNEKKVKKVVQASDDKCTFIITRGEKMGEKCSSRVKSGTSFCVKHFKPSKEDEVKEVKEEKEVKSDSKTVSLEMKFKKLDLNDSKVDSKVAEFVKDGAFRVVRGTKVVVNDSNDVIGYLVKDQVVFGSSKEVDQVCKQFTLSLNKSNWKPDHIDE